MKQLEKEDMFGMLKIKDYDELMQKKVIRLYKVFDPDTNTKHYEIGLKICQKQQAWAKFSKEYNAEKTDLIMINNRMQAEENHK